MQKVKEVPKRRAFGFHELAAAYGNSAGFWRMEFHRGNLRGIRLGRRVVIPVEALTEYLAAAESAARTSGGGRVRAEL